MRTEKVSFISSGKILAGLYHDAGNARTVIISHGFAGGKDSDKWTLTSKALTAAGYSVLRFDHSGCGESEGAFDDVTLSGRIAELRAAVKLAREGLDAKSVSLLGSSFGGVTVLHAASDPGIACSTVTATPVEFEFFDKLEDGVAADPGYIVLSGFMVKRRLMEDVLKYNVPSQASKVSRLLVMHGTRDELIPRTDANIIFGKARDPKKLHFIGGADHAFTEHKHRLIMIDQLIRWLGNF